MELHFHGGDSACFEGAFIAARRLAVDLRADHRSSPPGLFGLGGTLWTPGDLPCFGTLARIASGQSCGAKTPEEHPMSRQDSRPDRDDEKKEELTSEELEQVSGGLTRTLSETNTSFGSEITNFGKPNQDNS